MRLADFLLGSIPLLIDYYARQYLQDDLAKTMTELEKEFNIPMTKTYDFIIVGGGTAGCVLAGRLSENFNVLLLEAGGEPPPLVSVPWFAVDVAKDTSINYFFHTTADDTSTRNTGGNLTIHTGKMLGGSGSHNDMVHSRGSPLDYDNWANLTKDDSWKYENAVQYFKKSETYKGNRFGPESHAQYYGTDGPITVQLNELPIQDIWFAAGKELGFGTNDPNGFQNISFAPMNKAVGEDGQRSSSYSKYVKPYETTRANLNVIRYANVSEILLDNDNRAYGVAYTRHGVFPQIAHATKEVIVSAGCFSSPLLLMKSGIGPVKTLEDAGIPVRVPLEAVGKNMGEHPSVVLNGFTVNDTTNFLKIQSNETEKILEDFHKGGGILTMTWEGPQCFIASNKSEDPNWPDIWIAMAPSVLVDDSEPTISFYTVIGRPKSRGTLSLDAVAYKNGTRDDTELALIDYNFMSNPDDVEAMLEGIKFVLQIAENTTAFQRLNMTYNPGPNDRTCVDEEFRSDDYWRCFILERTLSWIHMVGTNSMGPSDGSSIDTVVDNELKVRGVKGLRVVDASVIPAVTNANLNAPIIMLAEKAADLIKKDHTDPSGTTPTTPSGTTEPSNGTLWYSNMKITFLFVVFSTYVSKLY